MNQSPSLPPPQAIPLKPSSSLFSRPLLIGAACLALCCLFAGLSVGGLAGYVAGRSSTAPASQKSSSETAKPVEINNGNTFQEGEGVLAFWSSKNQDALVKDAVQLWRLREEFQQDPTASHRKYSAKPFLLMAGLVGGKSSGKSYTMTKEWGHPHEGGYSITFPSPAWTPVRDFFVVYVQLVSFQNNWLTLEVVPPPK